MKSAEMSQISLFLFPCWFISPSDDTSLPPVSRRFRHWSNADAHFLFLFSFVLLFTRYIFSFLSFTFSLGEWSFCTVKSIFKSFSKLIPNLRLFGQTEEKKTILQQQPCSLVLRAELFQRTNSVFLSRQISRQYFSGWLQLSSFCTWKNRTNYMKIYAID